MNPAELKNCPFCGAEAKLQHYENDGYLPMCTHCDGMIERWFKTPEEATEKWNRRADE
jgi:Lar family restriction alleviation protein